MAEQHSPLTTKLIRDGLRRSRVPFDFNRRVALAKIYMEDGAFLTAADRLTELADEMRQAHADRLEAVRRAG